MNESSKQREELHGDNGPVSKLTQPFAFNDWKTQNLPNLQGTVYSAHGNFILLFIMQ